MDIPGVALNIKLAFLIRKYFWWVKYSQLVVLDDEWLLIRPTSEKGNTKGWSLAIFIQKYYVTFYLFVKHFKLLK